MSKSDMVNELERATVNGDTEGMKVYMISLLKFQLEVEERTEDIFNLIKGE